MDLIRMIEKLPRDGWLSLYSLWARLSRVAGGARNPFCSAAHGPGAAAWHMRRRPGRPAKERANRCRRRASRKARGPS